MCASPVGANTAMMLIAGKMYSGLAWTPLFPLAAQWPSLDVSTFMRNGGSTRKPYCIRVLSGAVARSLHHTAVDMYVKI
jgi:hypothetical protein